MRQTFAGALACALFLAPASATAASRPLNLTVSPPSTAPKFDKTTMYAVELSCSNSGKKDLEPYAEYELIVKKTFTTTLSLLIARTPPTKKTGGSDSLPASAVAYAPIVVVDKDGAIEVNNSNACKQGFLVYNASQLLLVPTVSLSTTYQAGFIVEFINKAIDFASAVAPLFVTGGIPVPVANQLSTAQKSVPPLNALLATLNKTRNYTATTALKIGVTKISTDYADITVTVRPVSSIVGDKNQDFLDDLKKGIDNAPTKLAAADQNPECRPLAVALNKAGFRSDQDKAFALGHLAVNTFLSKSQILICLGDYALPAANLGNKLWAGYPLSLVVTPDDAKNIPTTPTGPAQPPFQQLRAGLTDFMNALGQYARRDTTQPASAEVVARLTKQFAATVVVQDQTGGSLGAFGQTFAPPAIPALIDSLITKGFRRFGCFAETTDTTGKVESGATVIFLSFKAAPDAAKTTIANAIAIHPLYRDRVIETLRISDNSSGWIDSVLADRTKAYYCANLEIQKKEGQ